MGHGQQGGIQEKESGTKVVPKMKQTDYYSRNREKQKMKEQLKYNKQQTKNAQTNTMNQEPVNGLETSQSKRNSVERQIQGAFIARESGSLSLFRKTSRIVMGLRH